MVTAADTDSRGQSALLWLLQLAEDRVRQKPFTPCYGQVAMVPVYSYMIVCVVCVV